jgi:hypothetical protein
MDECLGRGIFGLPSHMKGAASCIRPGASIFLYHVTDRLLFVSRLSELLVSRVSFVARIH